MEWKTKLSEKFDKIFLDPKYNIIKEFNVKELKEFCQDQKLVKTGNKDSLIKKIIKYVTKSSDSQIVKKKKPKIQKKIIKYVTKSSDSQIVKKKKPKIQKKIDPILRMKIWEIYIGQKTNGKCYCCWEKTITPFTFCNTFHAGHIISRHNGGLASIDNLLPICRDCNMQMGCENWDSYIKRHPHLQLRRCGKNPPISRYMKGIVWIQSLIRMWLERKNLYKLGIL